MKVVEKKLNTLYAFLVNKDLRSEGLYLEYIIKKSNDNQTFYGENDTFYGNIGTQAVQPDRTQALQPERTIVDHISHEMNDFGELPGIVGPSREYHRGLEALGANPIRYIGGSLVRYMSAKESREKGLARSKNGNIYEVEYMGSHAVAKIVNSYDSEPEKWNRVLNIDLDPELRRHLPEIKEITDLPGDYFSAKKVIIMEKLRPLSKDIKKLFTLNGKSKSNTTIDRLKNDEFVNRAVFTAFDRTARDLSVSNSTFYNKILIFKKFISNRIVSDIFKENIKLTPITTGILESFSNLKKDMVRLGFSEDSEEPGSSEYLDSFFDLFKNNIEELFTPTRRAIPKYHHLEDSVRQKDPNEISYEDSPHRFMFAEDYLPETRSVFKTLHALRDAGIFWFDLHSGNVMERMETNSHGQPGDVVLIDIALYGSREEIGKYR